MSVGLKKLNEIAGRSQTYWKDRHGKYSQAANLDGTKPPKWDVTECRVRRLTSVGED